MLIIIEGCDGVGKSTLAEKLIAATSGTLLHRGPPEKDPLLEYTEELQSYRPRDPYKGIPDASVKERHIICDRWHWGELVYGPIYRGETKLGWEGMQQVDSFLLLRGALIVWVWEPVDVLNKRLEERGDDYIDVTHVPDICKAYSEVAWQSRVPVYKTRTPEQRDVWRITQLAQAFEWSAFDTYWRSQ